LVKNYEDQTPFIEINRFSLVIAPKIQLIFPPYKGSAFRGGFGHCLKKALCILKKDCHEASCPIIDKCLFKKIFGPKRESGSKDKIRNIPTPYIVEPPEEEKTVYQKGEEITFYLVLFGYTAQYIPYFLYAFELLGQVGFGREKHQFDILKATAVRGEEEMDVYDGRQKVLTNQTLPIHFEQFTASDTNSIYVSFITPTHIKSERNIPYCVSEFSFFSLFKAVLNRLSTLSYFYGQEKFEWDYKGILEKAKEVEIAEEESHLKCQTTRRYSQRKKREDFLTGVTGRMSYSGPHLGGLLPYLRFGQYAHVGYRTTFGLGKYRVFENLP
jgi:hypothetical protein